MTNYVKYPRTYHCPWSLSLSSDDKRLSGMSVFYGKRVVVTEKMDGENTTLYNGYYHARSIDSAHHPSRTMVKQYHANMSHLIPEKWRVCGENLYARHSIQYDNLLSYFYGFSVWDDNNMCLSWDETVLWFELLGVTSVPVLYDGVYDEVAIKSLYNHPNDTMEGYVIRVADSFNYCDFNKSVCKFVRENHVQTDKHWMRSEVVPNKLK